MNFSVNPTNLSSKTTKISIIWRNAVERMRLKDVIEDVNKIPKVWDTLEMMKKELRKMKVEENHEWSFVKENKMFYTINEDNRSRYNNWKKSLKSKGYVRSELNPKFSRTASKNIWDNSRLWRNNSIVNKSTSRTGS